MKRFLFPVLTILIASLLLAGCTPTPVDEPISGGVTDTSDPDAPKTIHSTEITRFSCYFSTLTMVEPGTLGNRTFAMSAEFDGDLVTGTYRVRDGGGETEKDFTAGAEFMDELQGIVCDLYDLAQFNGHHYYVAGLPENFGATLEIDYASGETIRADDNQENFLDFGAMDALRNLFALACAAEPELVPVRIDMQYEGAGEDMVSYPALSVGEDGYHNLSEALADINVGEASLAHEAAEWVRSEQDQWTLWCSTSACVTRSDNEYVSFYTKTSRMNAVEWDEPLVECRGYAIETATGKQLCFHDILRDMQLMPIAIGQALSRQYPDETFCDDVQEVLKELIDTEDGGVTFALSYGCMHVFIGEGILNDTPGGLHVILSYLDYPYLLHAFCTTEPEYYILPVESGFDYRVDSFRDLRMDWYIGDDESDGTWLAVVNGTLAKENYYAYEPDCWLIRYGERYYLYVRVPSGDVSMQTDVFELTADGIEKIGTAPFAMREDGNCDPRMMEMNDNRFVYCNATTLLPVAFCCVGDDGLPETVSSLYRLEGQPVALKQTGRYNPADREDAAVSGGMWNLFEGEVLTPLQTDMETFIDFMTDDGRVVRFSIDGFGYEMQLDNFGTLDDVFVPTYG